MPLVDSSVMMVIPNSSFTIFRFLGFDLVELDHLMLSFDGIGAYGISIAFNYSALGQWYWVKYSHVVIFGIMTLHL